MSLPSREGEISNAIVRAVLHELPIIALRDGPPSALEGSRWRYMKPVLITIFSLGMLTSTGLAQTEAKQQPKEVRRLENITWDLMSHTLRWTVKKGTEVNGEFIPVAEEHYEIKPDVATMKVKR
jgi:hypothetical protein